MNGYGPISKNLSDQLARIEPSRDGNLAYFPCLVTLADRSQMDLVYVVEFAQYIKNWGVRPEHDPGKRSLPIKEVIAAVDSPSRLPAKFANELYRAGESGMGYCVFTIVFRDGRREKVVTGNAVDFVSYPAGLGPADVIGVEPHTQPWSDATPGPGYVWCLYDDVATAT